MSPRSLLLLRHGKSSWETGTEDHRRPLKPRGQRAAALIGRFLRANGLGPDQCLTSSAVRARRTAELVLAAGGFDIPLGVARALYGATPAEVLELIQGVPGDVERLLVVGHEPTCSGLVATLAGGAPPRFPTACLAELRFDSSAWTDLAPGGAALSLLLPPRTLAAFDEHAPDA